jgi:hypothetical protein
MQGRNYSCIWFSVNKVIDKPDFMYYQPFIQEPELSKIAKKLKIMSALTTVHLTIRFSKSTKRTRCKKKVIGLTKTAARQTGLESASIATTEFSWAVSSGCGS